MSGSEHIIQKYKKKTEIIDERSTPEARAARVKRLRNLANLSRKDMCDEENLNMFTLKGWELARHGGLPLDGAHKVVKRVAREGVFCTVEWLLYEEGEPPKVIVGKVSFQDAKTTSEDSETTKLKEELTLFQEHYPSALYYHVIDDAMSPVYEPGDVVAGIPKINENIQDALGMNCIVQLASGEMLCRKLRKGKSEFYFNLISINTDTSVDNAMMINAILISAAPIIWHRKTMKG